jgi:PRC-barrel domain
MTLPGPEATHRWQGHTLVDHDGEPLGSIEIVYLDKATDQPEWALLEADAIGPTRTFIPLVSASEEGDTIRAPSPRP